MVTLKELYEVAERNGWADAAIIIDPYDGTEECEGAFLLQEDMLLFSDTVSVFEIDMPLKTVSLQINNWVQKQYMDPTIK